MGGPNPVLRGSVVQSRHFDCLVTDSHCFYDAYTQLRIKTSSITLGEVLQPIKSEANCACQAEKDKRGSTLNTSVVIPTSIPFLAHAQRITDNTTSRKTLHSMK